MAICRQGGATLVGNSAATPFYTPFLFHPGIAITNKAGHARIGEEMNNRFKPQGGE